MNCHARHWYRAYKGNPARIKDWAGDCEFGELAEDSAGI
jgi:hypothetical protein